MCYLSEWTVFRHTIHSILGVYKHKWTHRRLHENEESEDHCCTQDYALYRYVAGYVVWYVVWYIVWYIIRCVVCHEMWHGMSCRMSSDVVRCCVIFI